MDPDDVALFSPRLGPGEHLLWTGRPDTRVLFAPADAYLVPFSIVWCGVLVVFTLQAVRTSAPGPFPVILTVFAIAGLYMLFGRFIYKRVRNATTRYAVTNERALAAIGKRTFLETSVVGRSIAERLSRDERHVTVTIGAEDAVANSGALRQSGTAPNTGTDWLNRGRPAPFAFYDVENPPDLLSALDVAKRAH